LLAQTIEHPNRFVKTANPGQSGYGALPSICIKHLFRLSDNYRGLVKWALNFRGGYSFGDTEGTRLLAANAIYATKTGACAFGYDFEIYFCG
jgi:hypothetical protein